jgi:phenylacetate-CoA ligase
LGICIVALDFKLKNFFYPLALLKLHKIFDNNQKLSHSSLVDYQNTRLKIILTHAYENVPYYKRLFQKLNLHPDDIKNTHDLKLLPILDKKTLRLAFEDLSDQTLKKQTVNTLVTSGTSGRQTRVLVDKYANILEFVYYWRYWNGAGYRLGDTFAEFSNVYFINRPNLMMKQFIFQPFLRRLVLNNTIISDESVRGYHSQFKRFAPEFIKGLPSTLYLVALALQKLNLKYTGFRAVFSTGEILLMSQRKVIESVFGCKCYDSYGHIERAVAACECSYGRLHINMDYGIFELIDDGAFGDTDKRIMKVVGTSLHNMAMPLIRYDTGDYVELYRDIEACECGCEFPLIKRVLGREANVIKTPKGDKVPNLHLIFESTKHVLGFQIIQNNINSINIKIVKSPTYNNIYERKLLTDIQNILGKSMHISLSYCGFDDINQVRSKYAPIISSDVE